MQLKFYTLDVFTETRFGGNPLGVVLNADALPTGLMSRHLQSGGLIVAATHDPLGIPTRELRIEP